MILYIFMFLKLHKMNKQFAFNIFILITSLSALGMAIFNNTEIDDVDSNCEVVSSGNVRTLEQINTVSTKTRINKLNVLDTDIGNGSYTLMNETFALQSFDIIGDITITNFRVFSTIFVNSTANTSTPTPELPVFSVTLPFNITNIIPLRPRLEYTFTDNTLSFTSGPSDLVVESDPFNIQFTTSSFEGVGKIEYFIEGTINTV